jgi:DHA1 family inner membrane transport protein
MLSPAYALPYAISQPFLGPLGDRFGRARCIQVCMAGLAAVLILGMLAPNFKTLFASRVVAGVFGGGLVPLVLAALGDAYDMSQRQVVIGRMLFAMIGGQMLGSVVAGLMGDAFGWRSALAVASCLALGAAALAWTALPSARIGAGPEPFAAVPFRVLYGRVFGNPKAVWLFATVFVEGALFFGIFPYVGELLLHRQGATSREVSREVGLVLGAFGIGGLAYALTVRRLIAGLGVRRMCFIGSLLASAAYLLLSAANSWWLAALAMLASGMAFYMIHNSLQTEATELAPAARGSAVALFASALFLGQGAGPLLLGPLVQRAGFAPAFILIALTMAGLGQVVVRRIVDETRAGETPEAIA